MNCMSLGVRHVPGFDFTYGLSEAHSFGARERRHFDEFSSLPEKAPATRTEFIKHRIQQTRRRSYRPIRCEGNVDLVNLIELIGRLPRHQISNARRSATTKTNRDPSLTGLSIKLELSRRIKQAAKVYIVDPCLDCRAGDDQSKVISRAVCDYIEAAQCFSQSNFIRGVSSNRAHPVAAEFRR